MPLDNIHYRTSSERSGLAHQAARNETDKLRKAKDEACEAHRVAKERYDAAYDAAFTQAYDDLL